MVWFIIVKTENRLIKISKYVLCYANWMLDVHSRPKAVQKLTLSLRAKIIAAPSDFIQNLPDAHLHLDNKISQWIMPSIFRPFVLRTSFILLARKKGREIERKIRYNLLKWIDLNDCWNYWQYEWNRIELIVFFCQRVWDLWWEGRDKNELYILAKVPEKRMYNFWWDDRW